MDNKTKSTIVSRIWLKCGVFKDGVERLPDLLNVDDVLRAINLDEYYFQEEDTKKTPRG